MGYMLNDASSECTHDVVLQIRFAFRELLAQLPQPLCDRLILGVPCNVHQVAVAEVSFLCVTQVRIKRCCECCSTSLILVLPER